MKRTLFSIMAVAAIAVSLIVSCGGDDDDDITPPVVVIEHDAGLMNVIWVNINLGSISALVWGFTRSINEIDGSELWIAATAEFDGLPSWFELPPGLSLPPWLQLPVVEELPEPDVYLWRTSGGALFLTPYDFAAGVTTGDEISYNYSVDASTLNLNGVVYDNIGEIDENLDLNEIFGF